jgi:DNA polymerase-3 subunit delta'
VFGFKLIINQEHPKRILTACLKTRHIPNAFLFTGKRGVGKRITAITFAMACNCIGKELDTTEPCGSCTSCLKIKSGNHPDIIAISPFGSNIKIAQIRSLCHILAMKPYEARLRVVIISDAQTMNPSAGNALLKV